MRFFLLIFAAATTCHGAVPGPLAEALNKTAGEWDRWAYTEVTVTKDAHGRITGGETIVRFDPSKPYSEQFTPIKLGGKEPTPRQRADYRRRGEKRADALAQQADAAKAKSPEPTMTFDLNGATAAVDFNHAWLASESDGSLVYEIPLRSTGSRPLPVEKFRLIAKLARDTHDLENATLMVRQPFRMMLVAKIVRGHLSFDFTKVDSRHSPVLSETTGDLALSLLFVRTGGSMAITRTDFKHVTPYDERFAVKIGAIKALGF